MAQALALQKATTAVEPKLISAFSDMMSGMDKADNDMRDAKRSVDKALKQKTFAKDKLEFTMGDIEKMVEKGKYIRKTAVSTVDRVRRDARTKMMNIDKVKGETTVAL